MRSLDGPTGSLQVLECQSFGGCLRHILPRMALVFTTLVFGLPADAQSLSGGLLSNEILGGTPGFHIEEPSNTASGILRGARNMDAVGKPCLNVSARSEPQLINKAIYNHILVLDNHCAKSIKIKACYYNTDSCQEIVAPPYKPYRHIFGVFTSKNFRYSFREYSN